MAMGAVPANTYYLCFPRHWNREPLAWNPFTPCSDPRLYVRTAYLGGVFRVMEEHLRHRGLTFYVTPDLRALPSYGPRVVAVVQEDEDARMPAYRHKVRATFKCYGTRQACPPSLFRRPSYRNVLAHVHFLRNAARRLPGRFRYAWQRDALPPIYAIPLGYANQLALPVKPIAERAVDVFFAGSVTHKDYPVWSLKRWFGTPKDLSRTRMLAGVEKVQQRLPDCTVHLQLQPTFRRSFQASAAAYSESLMDARICLVPRGASLETYRFFEAMRYGCIILCEALPAHWFYEGSPVIQVTDWLDLPDIVAPLLNDADLLRAKHVATLAWWEARCSEAAVGRFMAEKLNTPGA